MADEFHLVSFDEDSYCQDPARFFARLRDSRPVAPVRLPGRGRAWFITRYADVWAALADPRLANDVHRWPGGARQRPSEAAGGVLAHLLNSDPPGPYPVATPGVEGVHAAPRGAAAALG